MPPLANFPAPVKGPISSKPDVPSALGHEVSGCRPPASSNLDVGFYMAVLPLPVTPTVVA